MVQCTLFMMKHPTNRGDHLIATDEEYSTDECFILLNL